MVWNWQHFTWNSDLLDRLEQNFLQQSGILIGSSKHFNDEDSSNNIGEAFGAPIL